MANIITKRYGRIKPPLGSILDEGYPLSLGLDEFWLKNEGGGDRIHNIRRNGNNGTLYNLTPADWIQKNYGFAIDFTSASDTHIQLDSKIVIPDNTPWTIFFRFTPTAIINWRGIYGNEFSSGKYTRLFLDNAGTLGLYNDANLSCLLSAALVVNVEAFIVLTCDGTDSSNIECWKNSVLMETDTLADSSQTIYRLGTSGSTTASCLDGSLEFFGIFPNRKLTPLDIAWLYHEPYSMVIAPKPSIYISIAAAAYVPYPHKSGLGGGIGQIHGGKAA